ncbi:TPA: hypothetical protein NV435_000186 [Enterobacter hormaechei subsp. xiangfangensis]|uniref:ead/Ea22-like family protein n=1 Tax=Enterobacter cloacae TaxID=550 RepID=UPI0021830E19|nr:ead/Ea22-like family protein [Enterobacter cloacae]MCT2766926.1 hypothetical protein [Enterobacter cloacae]HCJ7638109.1 hypothetical protein [Enterobacter hormaechei subsp. xiangfangensis]
MSNIDKQALREEFQFMRGIYSDPADHERQLIYIAAEALLDELEAKDKRIAELEAREMNGRFPLPKDSSQGWKIDPEIISKIQDAIGYDEECQCWEGSPSMEMVEAVLIAAAAIKMDERG